MQKRFSWFGGDYRKMDEHFSRNIYSTWVRPVYKLLLSEEEFSTFDTFVYHLFSQPLYMGDYMWCGVHNLFSGQAITNDFETIYNIIEKITMLLLDGQQPHLCIVRALGDDSIVGVKRWYSDPISLNRQLAEANGLTLAEDKSYISNVPIYLRKVYDLSFPKYVGSDVVIGAYPAVLAWNSLRNPERPLSSLNENFVASLQICDNLVGHPLYANIASMFWKYWRGDITSEVSNVEITDWWSKLYGSNWSFRNSPTANLLMNRNQLTPEMLNIISNCT